MQNRMNLELQRKADIEEDGEETAEIVSLDQGIIRSFKAKYRHLLLQHVLASLENKKVREQGHLFLLMLVKPDRSACLSLF